MQLGLSEASALNISGMCMGMTWLEWHPGHATMMAVQERCLQVVDSFTLEDVRRCADTLLAMRFGNLGTASNRGCALCVDRQCRCRCGRLCCIEACWKYINHGATFFDAFMHASAIRKQGRKLFQAKFVQGMLCDRVQMLIVADLLVHCACWAGLCICWQIQISQ